jgi:hypothetical protein
LTGIVMILSLNARIVFYYRNNAIVIGIWKGTETKPKTSPY